MKRMIVLFVALALVFVNTVSLAEEHAEPPKSYFANMKVRISDTSISMSFDKPVDRLFINWTDGSDPQELLVDENLQAFGFRTGHKYLPGVKIFDGISNLVSHLVYNGNTLLYEDIQINPETGKEVVRETKTYKRIQTVKYTDDAEKMVREFKRQYGADYEIEYKPPRQATRTVTVDGKTTEIPLVDKNGDFIYEDGELRAYTTKVKYFKLNVATPDQVAFITFQEEWIVCYNRSGKIVSIEYNELYDE